MRQREFIGPDALVTDYSGVALDYLLLDRPQVATPMDLDAYRKGPEPGAPTLRFLDPRPLQGLGRNPKVKGIWWYDFMNDGVDPRAYEHHFGLVDEKGQPLPAYQAMKDYCLGRS